MKLGNLLIQQTHQSQSADVLIIVLPVKTILLPLRLVKRTAHFVGDIAYWLLFNVFAGSEDGYLALHKR